MPMSFPNGVSRDGNATTPQAYGAKCDGKYVTDGVVSGSVAGSMVISSAQALAGAMFTAADVGKTICHVQRTVQTGQLARFGTITAVDTVAQTATCSLNAVTTGANQLVVWGTDDTAAYTSTIAAVAATNPGARPAILQPSAISIITSQVKVPLTGIRWSGVGGPNTVRGAIGSTQQLILTGPTICYIGADPGATGAICQGDSGNSDAANYGLNMTGIHVCAMNRASAAVGYDSAAPSNRNSHLRQCTFSMATDRAVESSASGVLEAIIALNTTRGTVVRLNGDSKLRDSYCYGPGSGLYTVRGTGGDVQITTNHLFRDANAPAVTGGNILLTGGTGQGTVSLGGLGSMVVGHNTLDTSYGPHIEIAVSASAYMRGVSIIGNVGFNNDNVPAATYPYMSLTGGAGSQLRAISVVGNVGQSSFADITKGTYTAFIDGAGMSGAIKGLTVGHNAIDNCAASYATVTPDNSTGNVRMAPGALDTVVVF